MVVEPNEGRSCGVLTAVLPEGSVRALLPEPGISGWRMTGFWAAPGVTPGEFAALVAPCTGIGPGFCWPTPTLGGVPIDIEGAAGLTVGCIFGAEEGTFNPALGGGGEWRRDPREWEFCIPALVLGMAVGADFSF